MISLEYNKKKMEGVYMELLLFVIIIYFIYKLCEDGARKSRINRQIDQNAKEIMDYYKRMRKR